MPYTPEPCPPCRPLHVAGTGVRASVAPLDFDLDLYRPDPAPPTAAVPAVVAPPAAQKPAVDPVRPPLDTTMPMPLTSPPGGPATEPLLSTMPHPPYDGGADHPLTIDLADLDTTPAALETPPPRPVPPASPRATTPPCAPTCRRIPA